MKTSALLPCVCDNEYQDKRYGKKLRVHARTKQNKAEHERGWRCSVCARVKEKTL